MIVIVVMLVITMIMISGIHFEIWQGCWNNNGGRGANRSKRILINMGGGKASREIEGSEVPF